MIVNEDAERMKQLLTEAITVLCKSGFNFASHFCVEGLLGITFDSKDIVLLNIKETITVEEGASSESKNMKGVSRSSVRAGQKKRKRRRLKSAGTGSESEDNADDAGGSTSDGDDVGKTFDTKDSKLNTGKRQKISSKSAPDEEHESQEPKIKSDSEDGMESADDSFLLAYASPQPETSDLKTPSTVQGEARSLPEAVKRFSVGDLRRIVVSLVTSEVPEGVGYPGWGKPDTKPVWWPTDVPWTKWGVQRGIKRYQLEKLVTEAMTYHGGKLPSPKEKKLVTKKVEISGDQELPEVSAVDVLQLGDDDQVTLQLQDSPGGQLLVTTRNRTEHTEQSNS